MAFIEQTFAEEIHKFKGDTDTTLKRLHEKYMMPAADVDKIRMLLEELDLLDGMEKCFEQCVIYAGTLERMQYAKETLDIQTKINALRIIIENALKHTMPPDAAS